MRRFTVAQLLGAIGCMIFTAGTLCAQATQPAKLKAPPASFANLTYPAQGNIQLDEGTVDLWIISGFDSEWESGPRYIWASPFTIVFPEEKWAYSINYLSRAKALVMVGYAQPEQPYVWAGLGHWEIGQVHHVVWTWKGRLRNVYVDGVCEWTGAKGKYIARDVDVNDLIHGDLTRATIDLGRGMSYVSIDELQIRNVAIPPQQIIAEKDSPPVADMFTLLLDHCDGGPAEIIAGRSGETGGRLSGDYQIVEGRFGKAIKLWKAVE